MTSCQWSPALSRRELLLAGSAGAATTAWRLKDMGMLVARAMGVCGGVRRLRRPAWR